jgi:Ca2+-binding RTX toxin-like protein
MWRTSSRHRAGGLIVLAVAFALLAPAAAAAATRYASPTGTNTTDCPQSDPCSLNEAWNGIITSDGDVVIVLPGDYDLGAISRMIDEKITVQGQDGQPLPHIHGSSGTAVLDLEDTVTLRRLWIEQTNPAGGPTVRSGAVLASTLDQSRIESAGSGACRFEGLDTTITDSVCAASGNGGIGVTSYSVNSQVTMNLRNVTAIGGTGPGSYGIEDLASDSGDTNVVQGRNVIARGGSADVAADTGGAPNATATVNLTNSNYDTEYEHLGGTVTDPGTGSNQIAPPLLATDGFHELAGSPTIDAGDGTPPLGSVDIDGEQRIAGASVDIGADEFQPPPLPKCRGRTATIVGTGGKLNGTSKNDVIVGSTRRDVINAGGGADLVCVRGGNDKVLGGAGKDTLLGQGGRDRLLGGKARDLLLGGAGRDFLAGGGGRDLLRGGPGRDISRQ